MKTALTWLMVIILTVISLTSTAQIYARGTFTSWNTDYIFRQTGTNVYTASSVYMPAGAQEMKFANNTFSDAWGDGNGLSGTVVYNPTGNTLFTVPANGYYDIVFNMGNLSYSITQVAYSATNQKMYVSGGFNSWSTANRMALVGNNVWRTPAPITLTAASYEMKFRNHPDWQGNDWGGASGTSGTAVQTTGGGPNISFTISTAGDYYITFNEVTRAYSVSLASLLPLTLVECAAIKKGGQVQLIWKTINEFNASRFDVERSPDARNFSTLSSVASVGNTRTITNYSFDDKAPLTGKSYYRLKSVDVDGRFSYSKVMMIDFSRTIQLSVSPNPAANFLNIEVNAEKHEEVQLTIVDVNGNAVLKRTIHLIKGFNAIPIDVSLFAGAMYIIRIGDKTGTFVKR